MRLADINEVELLKQIDEKLSILITLNAVNLSANKDLDSTTKVRLLSLAKFTSEEIGEMLGIRADSVRHIRSKARKRGAQKVKVAGQQSSREKTNHEGDDD